LCRLDNATAKPAPRRGTASIADSFWRPERTDRTYAQTILDETLIQKVDVEYADDEIGSLDGGDVATRDLAYDDDDPRVQAALDDFLQNYRKGNRVVRHLLRTCHFQHLSAGMRAMCARATPHLALCSAECHQGPDDASE
jgi:hypothetical protein